MFGKLFAIPGMKGAALLIVALLIACTVLWLHSNGLRDRLTAAEDKIVLKDAEIDLLRADVALKETASIERQADIAAIAQAEKELLDVIQEAPDAQPDGVRVRLGCERLRRAGRLDADLPASCRSGG